MTSQTALTAPVAVSRPSRFSVLTHPRVYVALILLSLLLVIPALSDSPFVVHVFVTICVFAGLSTAWNIVGGYAGQLSLGHMMFYGIGGYTTALLIQHFGLSPWIGMWAGAALSAVVAVCIGYPSFRLRGPFFSLATIAFLEVIRLLAIHFHGVTGGSAGLIVPLKIGWAWMIFQDKFNYLIIAFGLLLLTLVVSFAIRNARLGYYLTAVREREDAASAAGISPTNVKLKAVVISAALTSLIGTTSTVPSSGPATVPSPPISENIAISIEVESENIVAGSRKVVYIAWNEPIRLVSAAEITTALSLTSVGLMPAAEAASSRSRTAVR